MVAAHEKHYLFPLTHNGTGTLKTARYGKEYSA
jgi:hypothetical protein